MTFIISEGGMEQAKTLIERGKTALGIELGSTRIKAVLIGEDFLPLASGSHEWENRFEGGIWTYTLQDIEEGLKSCYRALKEDVSRKYGITLRRVGAIGVSAMMHGYMPLDGAGNLLSPFRTWRNNIASAAADRLTELFGYHIPARWTVAHLYQAILAGEEHTRRIDYLTTLEGYIHLRLTGRKVIGVGEASGMFPVDPATKGYNAAMLEKFNALIAGKVPYKVQDILPKILLAGEEAGTLTEEGARFLDPAGDLESGIPLCPPEGDAGTGMVATNAVRVHTGNISAGTSVFAMIVLDREPKKPYPEIDLVTTPAGELVGMVHCNNCTSDLNGWVGLFGEFSRLAGAECTQGQLFDLLFHAAERGETDCGGLLNYNYVSGENITGVEGGRPLFVRSENSRFDLANFMRAQLYSAFATLKLGCDIMLKEEGVRLDRITGHGGIFKTEGVAQNILAAAIGAPVTVMKTAGEGGAWGMAVLADYLLRGKGRTLEDHLENVVFAGQEGKTLFPDPAIAEGFEKFIARYRAGLPVVREAVGRIG